jgi:hypothetical protein
VPLRLSLGTTRAPIAVNPVLEGGRLSGGMLIEASVLARLLRLRLLTVDASVLLLPAGLSSPAPPIAPTQERRNPEEPRRQLTPRGSGGNTLADAIRSIDEGSELLAQTRRNRSLLDGQGSTDESTPESVRMHR